MSYFSFDYSNLLVINLIYLNNFIFDHAYYRVLKDVAVEEEDGIIQQLNGYDTNNNNNNTTNTNNNNNNKSSASVALTTVGKTESNNGEATDVSTKLVSPSNDKKKTETEKLTVPDPTGRVIQPVRKQSTLTGSLNDEQSARLKKFPNLNYTALYHSLMNIIEIIPTLQLSQIPVGQALIHTFSCLAPFLPDDLVESLPYNIALTLITFPKDLQKYIVEILCNTLIPMASKFKKFLFFKINFNYPI